jgi:hypothetical protein
MAMWKSYGMRVLGVLTVVSLGLWVLLALTGMRSAGHLDSTVDLSRPDHAESALLGLGLALVAGLRIVERLDRSVG